MQKTILVVNDSSLTTRIICTSLQKEGFITIPALDGKDAIPLLDKYNFDLVITDLNMPEMDGIQLTKQIRAHKNHKYIPVLFLSGNESNDKTKEAKEAGSSAWISMPYDAKKMLIAINKFLR
jgi:two-component system chemotaxis response regulator CheY